MIFSGKGIDKISADDILGLVEAGVPEGKEVDYKQNMPANDNDGKKEFLADVSSFANTTGGYLIFGVREKNLIPIDVCGLPITNPDVEIQRLENMIRDGIDPRIPSVATRAVPLGASKYVVLIHIPKSFLQPHVVRFQNHWRFYARHSAGKYPLDVDEVRSAFLLSESIADRVRQYRAERLGKIISGETPVRMPQTPKFILHVVPAGSFSSDRRIDLLPVTENWGDWLLPIRFGGASSRYNLDGFLSYAVTGADQSPSYIQLFNNGCIEAVVSFNPALTNQDRILPARGYEKLIIQETNRFLRIGSKLGFSLPLFVMISFHGVLGYAIRTRSSFSGNSDAIDRDDLILPEVMFNDFETDTTKVLKPAFDSLWNAGGWPGSMSYKEGKWIDDTQ
jgi:hypothetical protein